MKKNFRIALMLFLPFYVCIGLFKNESVLNNNIGKQEFQSNFKNSKINLNFNKQTPISEGDYNSWSGLSESGLTSRDVKVYTNNIGVNNNAHLKNKYTSLTARFDVRIGINEYNGNSYNFYNSYLNLEVLLSSISSDANILNNPYSKKKTELKIKEGNNIEIGLISFESSGTFTFEKEVGTYDKWVFLNAAFVLEDNLNLRVKYNGMYRFKNGSTTTKYINVFYNLVEIYIL